MSAPASPLAVETHGLGRRYGGVYVVRDVNLALPPGSRTALIGPNGAGKTTLLAMLSTLVTPSDGEARVAGISTRNRPPELRRRLGILAHRPMLYEELSPLENLRFFAQLYGVPAPEPRIEELLRAVGVWRRRDEPTTVFSRGFHQRLAIARALIHDPDVLLIDEPETGLDPAGVELLDEMMLRREGVTVLASTHRVERIDRWATGLVRLERGRVAEDTASVLPRAEATREALPA